MKKSPNNKPEDGQIFDALKRLIARIEDATIDIGSIKTDLKFVNLRLTRVEHNTDITKVDVEKIKGEMVEMKKDIREVKRNTEGLIETTGHILREAVTHDEYNALSQRVSALEQS